MIYQYANDVQFGISIPGDSAGAVTDLSQCLMAVMVRMVNRHQLNTGKTAMKRSLNPVVYEH